MKYKDFGQGVLAAMLLAGATVMFVVSEGSMPAPTPSGPVSSPVFATASAQTRQQPSEHFHRTSAASSERPAGTEQISWVF